MPRTKGSKSLSKPEKAQIIAQKNASIYSPSEIAENFGVSKSTVTHLSLETVPEDVALLARGFETAYITYVEASAMKAIKRAYDTIDDLPADKATVVHEKNFHIAQLHRNRPTAITKTQTDPIELYVAQTRRVVIEANVSAEVALEVGIQRGYIPAEYKDQVFKMLQGETST